MSDYQTNEAVQLKGAYDSFSKYSIWQTAGYVRVWKTELLVSKYFPLIRGQDKPFTMNK